MKLDVGCGCDPHGDVNCDILRLPISNFVRCDAHKLPFIDESFSIVYSSHVLEHLHNPLQALCEWRRVVNGKVVLILPSEYHFHGTLTHLYSWNIRTLDHLLGLVFPQRKLRYGNRRVTFHEFHGRKGAVIKRFVNLILAWVGLPSELYAVCYK